MFWAFGGESVQIKKGLDTDTQFVLKSLDERMLIGDLITRGWREMSGRLLVGE